MRAQGSVGKEHLLSKADTYEARTRQSVHSSRYDSHCRLRKPVHHISPLNHELCSHLNLCMKEAHWRVRSKEGHYDGFHAHHLCKSYSQREEQVLGGRNFLRSGRGIVGCHFGLTIRSIG